MPDFVSFQTIQRFHKIAHRYNPVSTDKIITIVDNNPAIVKAQMGLTGYKVWVNGLLEELHVKTRIRSLPEVPLPQYDVVDPDTGVVIRLSETDRINRTLDYEWATARFELRVYCAAVNGQWVEYGAVALKNSNGHRYRIHRLLDLITENVGAKLGDYGKIGIQVLNVGYGYVQGNDEIDITGHWTQEICLTQPQPPYAVVNNYATASSTPTPTPTPAPTTYNPTISAALPTGKTNAGFFYNTQITASGSGFPPNTLVSLIWVKGTTEVGGATNLNSGTTGVISNTYNSTIFANSGAGQYKLKATYGETTIYSGEITVIDDSPTFAFNLPAASLAYIGRKTPLSIDGYNWLPNTAATLEWLKGGTAILSAQITTDAKGEYHFSFTADALIPAPFNGAGQYTVRLTQGNTSKTSGHINLTDSTCVCSPSSVSLPSSGTTSTMVTCVISNYVPGETISTIWTFNNGDVAGTSVTRTIASDGNLTFTFDPNTVRQSPFPGEGSYRLKVIRGNYTILGNTISITSAPPVLR